MTDSFTLLCRGARRRALLGPALAIALLGCNAADAFDPTTNGPADPAGGPVEAPLLATRFAGGIPIGLFAQPTGAFGSQFNGALRTIAPDGLLRELAAIKARGGRVILMMAGNPRNYRDRSGHFSLTEWKSRVNRFRHINFSSYVKDGTLIAHYLMDEPNDPANWRGQRVSAATVEEMARYSKQFWPNLPTVVRTDPSYLNGSHRHLDAAWAQYLYRRGNVSSYISRAVADAKRRGLALVVGMNIIKGGPNGRPMTPQQVQAWGGAILANSYPCAFISWQYSASKLNSGSMRNAMMALRHRAQSRAAKSCRG